MSQRLGLRPNDFMSSRTLRNPVVSVVIVQLAEHKVYVGGDVAKPGYVVYRAGLTPLQAVFQARCTIVAVLVRGTLAGVLAGTMSPLAAKALAISSLFVRNVYRQIWPGLGADRGVLYARGTIVAVLILGTASAWLMRDFFSIMNLVLTVNIPFGAAVLLAFFWRRLTAAAVWWCVILTTLVVLVIPWTASHVPGLRDHPGLTRMTSAGSGAAPAPVFYNRVVRERPGDPVSPLVAAPGLNRLNLECWLLSRVGVDVDVLSRTQRVTLQFLFDGIFPFVVLLAASLLTRPTDPRRVAEFYGKMKTPVGATPDASIHPKFFVTSLST